MRNVNLVQHVRYWKKFHTLALRSIRKHIPGLHHKPWWTGHVIRMVQRRITRCLLHGKLLSSRIHQDRDQRNGKKTQSKLNYNGARSNEKSSNSVLSTDRVDLSLSKKPRQTSKKLSIKNSPQSKRRAPPTSSVLIAAEPPECDYGATSGWQNKSSDPKDNRAAAAIERTIFNLVARFLDFLPLKIESNLFTWSVIYGFYTWAIFS